MLVLRVRRVPAPHLRQWTTADERLATTVPSGEVQKMLNGSDITSVDCIGADDGAPFDDASIQQRFLFCIRNLNEYDALLLEPVDETGSSQEPWMFLIENDTAGRAARKVAQTAIAKAVELSAVTEAAEADAAEQPVAAEQAADDEAADDEAAEQAADEAAAANVEEIEAANVKEIEAAETANVEETAESRAEPKANTAEPAVSTYERAEELEPEWLTKANAAIANAAIADAAIADAAIADAASRPSAKPTAPHTTSIVSEGTITTLVGVLPPALMQHFAKVKASVLTDDGEQRFVAMHGRNEVRVGKQILNLQSWDDGSYEARNTPAREPTPRPPVRMSFLRTI